MGTMKYKCPVCGYPELHNPPRVGDGGSYEICPSCGFQFGVDDDDKGFTYERWRQQWIERGMPWNSIGIRPPAGWNPQKQLRSLLGGEEPSR